MNHEFFHFIFRKTFHISHFTFHSVLKQVLNRDADGQQKVCSNEAEQSADVSEVQTAKDDSIFTHNRAFI